MSDSPHPSVLIAGSGPTGLVLALTLAKNGIPVRIIDKDSAFHVGQRGACLQPRTLELYNFLGVLPDIMKNGTLILKYCDYEMPGGRVPAKIIDISPYEDVTPSVPYRNPWMIGQGHTQEILRSHLSKYGVMVELNTELVDFEQHADGVTVNLLKRNGSTEQTEKITVDWLVGADGARSLVRKRLGLNFEGETRENRLLIADFELKGLSTEYWHAWGDMSTKVIYIRPTEYENGFSTVIFGHEVDFDHLFAGGRDAIVEFIKGTTNRPELDFGKMSWISEWRPNIRMVNKFGQGRVFVVGDAAHVHPPTGGQGLNSGAQDAFNLAWKLSLVHKGLAHPSLLESYTTERLPVIAEMLGRTTAIFNETLKADSSSDADPHMRPKILHQLGVNCRWSAILVDEQAGAKEHMNDGPYLSEDPTVLYAGDRAPDAPGLLSAERASTETISLFKIFGPTQHTVLVFAAAIQELQTIIDALAVYPEGTVTTIVIFPQTAQRIQAVKGATLIIVDRDGHTYAGYPPASKGYPIIAVRPDGVVGAIVRGVTGLTRYFGGLFIAVSEV